MKTSAGIPVSLLKRYLCVLAVLAGTQAYGQAPPTGVPRFVQFSGVVKDAAGKALNGAVGLTIGLYAEAEGGVPLWSEAQNVTPDTRGHYSLLLGATQPDGLPLDVFASGQARWLGVTLQEAGAAEQPRVLLVVTPYALKAADADTLGGKPASAYLLAGSSISAQPAGPSGTVQPVQPEAAVSARTAAGAKPAFTSTGTTNYVSKFTDTSGDTGNSVMYQNGSNIGVGTTAAAISMDVCPTATSPYAQLGVAQTVDYMTLFASDKYGPAFFWDPTKALRFGKGGTGLYNANGFTEYMRIQPNGYVGIGTLTPAATLEVNGNAQVDGGTIFTSGNVPVIQFPSGASENFSAGLSALPPNTTGFYNTAIGDLVLANNTTGFANTASGVGALLRNTTGSNNTATGGLAMDFNTTGANNTASGYGALQANTTGGNNTASGVSALLDNTTGSFNTASGFEALQDNTTGSFNTASGSFTLYANTTGANNTASGYQALQSNTTGVQNTASGLKALFGNTTGTQNTASGSFALSANTTGSFNTAFGSQALQDETTGGNNTASGYQALNSNYDGALNTAIGYQALYANLGSSNIGIGAYAGSNVLALGNNIDIGNAGTLLDSGAIRIGIENVQTSAYIAGIWGATTLSSGAVPVLIDSNGNLGTISSSRRYKEDIRDMADASSELMRLRPVTFRYKKPFDDGSQPIQYGLIAEEVAEVYPDLVARSANGQIETVKYQVLGSMLLNELQKQNATIAAQKEQIRSLEERLARVEAALSGTTVTASTP